MRVLILTVWVNFDLLMGFISMSSVNVFMGSSRILTDFNFQVSRILVNWPEVFFICIVEILLSLTLSFYGSSRLFSVNGAFVAT